MIEGGLDAKPARGLGGEEYWPGSVGLNNVGKTDYVNSIVQALVHVRGVRDWFLAENECQAEGEGGEEGKGRVASWSRGSERW